VFKRSGSVEANLRNCMVGINAAHGPCGVRRLLYFVKSSAGALSDSSDVSFAAQLLAFAAEEEGFGHSLAMCPTPPQKRQRLLAKRRIRSAGVSFPSLPSLLPMSDVLLSELRADKPVLRGADCFVSCFDGEVFGRMRDVWSLAEFVPSKGLGDRTFEREPSP